MDTRSEGESRSQQVRVASGSKSGAMLTASSMVPVAANGWEDIQKRMQFQENIASVHQEKVKVGDAFDQPYNSLHCPGTFDSAHRAVSRYLDQVLYPIGRFAKSTNHTATKADPRDGQDGGSDRFFRFFPTTIRRD